MDGNLLQAAIKDCMEDHEQHGKNVSSREWMIGAIQRQLQVKQVEAESILRDVDHGLNQYRAVRDARLAGGATALASKVVLTADQVKAITAEATLTADYIVEDMQESRSAFIEVKAKEKAAMAIEGQGVQS